MSKEVLIEGLNPEQRKALLHTEGPLLLFAGAGSGKTRVITYKFAYLVKTKKATPQSILTVTFTNKAAAEMKARIESLIARNISGMWIGTFHAMCNRILRREIAALGYSNNFMIYDEADQHNLIKKILKDFNIHEALYKGIASKISFLKSSLVTPEAYLSQGDGYGFDEKLTRVYIRYHEEMKKCNVLDFDDLIMLTVRLFAENTHILNKYKSAFPYLLVDEFQDTNCAQYELLKQLSGPDSNICVVGDDDQSIYRFRGADVSNILNFEKDFPGATVIKLEQNYRSTQNILNVSGAVISKNLARSKKTLWTEKGSGEAVCYYRLNSEEEEAKHVVSVIKEMYLKGTYEYKDFAILYRLNMQSRAIEEALRTKGIPYKVFGGISFYERKEIKDLIAYMRLAINLNDDVSFRRIINRPHRGIGLSALTKIEQDARKKSSSLFAAIKTLTKSDGLASGTKEKLSAFIKLIEQVSSSKYKTAADMLKHIVDVTEYLKSVTDEQREQNISELILSAEGKEPRDFIDSASLYSRMDDRDTENSVSLMTLHSAKGLEFPVVFIVGLEEGLLPYFKATGNRDELQEERRLFYVGITRAKDLLWLIGVKKRRFYSKIQEQEISRFVKDMPRECCQWIEKTSVHNPMNFSRKKDVFPAINHQLSYSLGCRVRHPKWGVGVVRDCYGEGNDQKVMVNFPAIGIKRLALRFANLEKIK